MIRRATMAAEIEMRFAKRRKLLDLLIATLECDGKSDSYSAFRLQSVIFVDQWISSIEQNIDHATTSVRRIEMLRRIRRAIIETAIEGGEQNCDNTVQLRKWQMQLESFQRNDMSIDLVASRICLASATFNKQPLIAHRCIRQLRAAHGSSLLLFYVGLYEYAFAGFSRWIYKKQNYVEFGSENTTDAWSLTHREQQILRCISDGQSNKQICSDLCITYSTLRTHIKSAYRKIGELTRS